MELVINTDGGSRGNPGPAAVGMIARYQDKVIAENGAVIGTATNNEAEYQAVLFSFNWLQEHLDSLSELTQISWKLDSKLVVEQLNRNWKIKEPRMRNLAQKVWQQLESLPCQYTFQYVPRAKNADADALVNQALDAELS